MGLDFTWLGLEKSEPPSPGNLEKPDPNANPDAIRHQAISQANVDQIYVSIGHH